MIQPPSKAAAMPCDGRLLRWPQRGMETKFHISISDNMWLQDGYLLVSSWFRICWCGCEFTYRGAAHTPHSFSMNGGNHFKISTMWRKRLHCTDSTYFHIERTLKTYFLCRSKKLATLRLRFSYIIKYADSAGTFTHSNTPHPWQQFGLNPKNEESKAVWYVLSSRFSFCNAALNFCPTK